jgi:uncharacterized protein YndB with AHSA1/START domain
MAAEKDNAQALTTSKRTSDRETVVTRTFKGPARLVYKAWTTPELVMRWWAPKSIEMSFLSCEMDLRVGGAVRFVFKHPSFSEPMAFFGHYREVVPNRRLVWTNEESEDGSITTVTFEEKGGETIVVVHDLYPSKTALDDAIASGSAAGYDEQFGQLDELLVTLGA